MVALETLGLVLFVVLGVAVANSFTQGPPAISLGRGPVAAMVRDALVAIHDLPSGDVFTTALEKVVAKGLQGNTTLLDNLIQRALPDLQCRFWVDNGHQRHLVAGPTERLARESVSASRLWRPEWAYAFAVPTFDVVSEVQPLGVQGYQVSQGAMVKERGAPLQFTLTTEQGNYTAGGVTSSRPGAPTASLFLLNETDQASFAYFDDPGAEVTTAVLQLSAPGPLPQPRDFTVPEGQDALKVAAYVSGTTMRYTMTFRDPVGASWSVAADGVGWHNLSIPLPRGGTWNFSAAGTIEGNLVVPAKADLWVNGTSTGAASTWAFVVREDNGQALPAGTRLNVTLPSVLTGLDHTRVVQAGWTNVRLSGGEGEEAWVSAELAAPLQRSQVVLRVVAGLPLEADALFGVTATLGNGSSARASFVLGRSTGVMNVANTLDHGLVVSVPKPHASGATALWGAVFAYPASAGVAEGVTRFDVRVADGGALFTGVQGVAPAGGWSLVSASHLRWEGRVDVPPNRVLAFVFNVTVHPEVVYQEEPSVRLPVVFGTGGGGGIAQGAGSRFNLTQQARPYVYAGNIPPPLDVLGEAQPGFIVPPQGGPLAVGNGTFNMSQVERGMLVKGTGQYGVSGWGTLGSVAEALRLGVARSQLDISRQGVGLGEEVNVSVDFQGLFDELEVLGQPVTAWSVAVKVFDPSQPFVPFKEMLPSLNGTFGASLNPDWQGFRPKLDTISSWATSSVDVFDQAKANITMRVPWNAFYGPHAVVVQANFVIENPITGESIVQSARILGVIDVLPDSGQSGTALYWVVLECWRLDW